MSDEVSWFLDAIKALGVAGGPVFAVLWWLERTERREAQKTTALFLTQVLTATSQSTASITKVSEGLEEVGESSRSTTTAIGQLATMVRALASTLRRKGLIE